MLDAARTIPRALVIGIKNFTFVIKADAAGAADAAGGGNHLALFIHAHAPAAIGRVAVERTGEAQHHPHVAVLVELRTKRVFVIIAGDSPAVADRLEDIAAAVAVFVLDARDFAALRGVEPAVVPVDANRLVQAARVKFQLHVVRLAERIADGKNIAAPRADRKFAVGQHREAAGLQRNIGRNGHTRERVIIALLRCGRAVDEAGQ